MFVRNKDKNIIPIGCKRIFYFLITIEKFVNQIIHQFLIINLIVDSFQQRNELC